MLLWKWIMHKQHTKGLKQNTGTLAYSICSQAAFTSQWFPEPFKKMLWHKSSQRLVTPKPLSARYSPSTPGKPALSGCVEQQSLKHHSHPLRRLDKLNFCSPVASSGKHRVDLKVKAVFPCVAETAVPESKEFCKTEGALASSIYGYMLTK